LFVHLGPKETLVVLIYVYDLIIIWNNVETISHLMSTLQHQFSIKDLINLKYFFEIEITVSH
jgi:hypothetical protein